MVLGKSWSGTPLGKLHGLILNRPQLQSNEHSMSALAIDSAITALALLDRGMTTNDHSAPRPVYVPLKWCKGLDVAQLYLWLKWLILGRYPQMIMKYCQCSADDAKERNRQRKIIPGAGLLYDQL